MKYLARHRVLLPLFLGMALSLPAQEGLGIYPGTDLAALEGRGTSPLGYRVERGQGEWSGWLDCSVNLHGVTDIPLEKLRTALLDFENYPGYFKRCLGAAITGSGEESGPAFTLGVKILGFTFATDFITLAAIMVDTEETFDLLFTQRADYSSLYGAWGEWYLRRVEINGRIRTYYRFAASAAVIGKFSLQEWIMVNFGAGEFRDLANQLLRAASRLRTEP